MKFIIIWNIHHEKLSQISSFYSNYEEHQNQRKSLTFNLKLFTWLEGTTCENSYISPRRSIFYKTVDDAQKNTERKIFKSC